MLSAYEMLTAYYEECLRLVLSKIFSGIPWPDLNLSNLETFKSKCAFPCPCILHAHNSQSIFALFYPFLRDESQDPGLADEKNCSSDTHIYNN
jgi:hypothetical protein